MSRMMQKITSSNVHSRWYKGLDHFQIILDLIIIVIYFTFGIRTFVLCLDGNVLF